MLLLLLLLQASGESTLQKLEREIAEVVARVRPCVVQVRADDVHLSGICWDRQGHVVTASSGVAGAREISVSNAGRRLAARHLASDRRTGVSVLHVEGVDGAGPLLAPEVPKEGLTALVIGNAFGLRGSVSLGTLAGKGCSVLVEGLKFENLLQFHVTAQPGDGGGFVADSSGRLLGMLHSATAAAEGQASDLRELLVPGAPRRAPAVAYAVPAAWIRFSADRIIRHGRMIRGWMGASLLPAGDAVRTALGLAPGEGAEVARVERDSPARRAGLEAKDVLLSFDGSPVGDLEALQWKVAACEEPVTVKIEYFRDRERRVSDLRIEIDPQR